MCGVWRDRVNIYVAHTMYYEYVCACVQKYVCVYNVLLWSPANTLQPQAKLGSVAAYQYEEGKKIAVTASPTMIIHIIVTYTVRLHVYMYNVRMYITSSVYFLSPDR